MSHFTFYFISTCFVVDNFIPGGMIRKIVFFFSLFNNDYEKCNKNNAFSAQLSWFSQSLPLKNLLTGHRCWAEKTPS